MASKVDAKMVVNSDTHAPEDMITEEMAIKIAMGAGMSKLEAETAINKTPREIIRRIRE